PEFLHHALHAHARDCDERRQRDSDDGWILLPSEPVIRLLARHGPGECWIPAKEIAPCNGLKTNTCLAGVSPTPRRLSDATQKYRAQELGSWIRIRLLL